MKKATLKKGIAVIVAIAALAFTGCPISDDGQNVEAKLTGITVAGTSLAAVPDPVSRQDWESAEFDLLGLESNQLGQVVIDQESQLSNAAIAVTASSGATVKYAAADFEKPSAFGSSPLTLSNNGYLCIQVSSEDGKTVNYYVVEIKLKNTITTLTSVTVGGITAVTGASGAAYTGITSPGSVGLSASTKTNAKVEVVKANPNQTVQYAKVAAGTSGAPAFGAADTFSFEDGDVLYIEVTAENGVNKGYYKIGVEVGRDTSLSSVTIGGIAVINTGTSAAAAADVPDAEAGSILFTTAMPSEGYAVAITATDPGAAVKWAQGTGTASQTAPSAYGTTTPIPFVDEGFLFIEVTAANTTTKAYYKIKINLLMSATIKYGSPTITSGTVDILWDSVTETYRIAKVSADQLSSLENTQTTFGVAKALFDEDGLYIYVDVTDPSIDLTNTSFHAKDSVELFINEGVDTNGTLIKDPVDYDTKGGQYRVDAAGTISGNPDAAPAAMNAQKVSAWTKTGGGGYIVIFQAPWRFTDSYPLANGKKIGFELQINACSAGARDGILVWNNVANTNYRNVTNYGEARLDTGSGTLKVNAKAPDITTHPAGRTYVPGDEQTNPELTVAATSTDGGTITYQWYSNTENSVTGGTMISGATQAAYTPAISFTQNGSYYFWAEVKNSIADNSDGGNKIAVRNSSIALIQVSTVALVEKIYTGGSSVPAYRFTLPAGAQWSDYTKLTFSVMIADQEVLDMSSNVRAHIVGNVPAADIGNNGIWNKQSGWGDARLVTISNSGSTKSIVGEDYELYTWKVLENSITNTGNSGYVPATYYPAADATGPFFFGLGITGQNNTTFVTYYIKDVALVKSDGTKLPADDIGAPFGSTTLGQLKCQFTSVVPERTLEPEPSAP